VFQLLIQFLVLATIVLAALDQFLNISIFIIQVISEVRQSILIISMCWHSHSIVIILVILIIAPLVQQRWV
jgi:hypothetical protein